METAATIIIIIFLLIFVYALCAISDDDWDNWDDDWNDWD